MKKIFALALSILMVLSLTSAALADQLNVGIVQMADNGAFTDMREGFIDHMRELGYDEAAMTFAYQNAQGDATNLASICQKMIEDGVDFVVTIATPPTQAMVNMDSDIPVFFISVSNPVGAGVITEMAHPDKNATGTSNAIPCDEMFKLSDKLTPGCKTYGLIYCTSEVNSVSTAAQAKAYMDANGLTYVEKVVTNSGEVQQAAEALVDSVDAIFVPNDSVVQTAMPVLAEIAADAGIPVYGSSAVMVASGAFATISIGDRAIGAITADMVNEYLNGKAIADIPAIVVDEFTMVINKATAAAISAELTEEVLAEAVIIE